MWFRFSSQGSPSSDDSIGHYDVVSTSLTAIRRIPLFSRAGHLVSGLHYGLTLPKIAPHPRKIWIRTTGSHFQNGRITNPIIMAWYKIIQKLYLCSGKKVSKWSAFRHHAQRLIWDQLIRTWPLKEFPHTQPQEADISQEGSDAPLVQRRNEFQRADASNVGFELIGPSD